MIRSSAKLSTPEKVASIFAYVIDASKLHHHTLLPLAFNSYPVAPVTHHGMFLVYIFVMLT